MAIYSIVGDGKGKTSSAIGVAVRSLSNNYKVIFVQYLKSGTELALLNLENLFDKFKFMPQGLEGFEIVDCKQFHNYVDNYINLNQDSDLIILDEVFTAIELNVLDYEDLTSTIKKYSHIDMYLTGLKPRKHMENLCKISDVLSIVTSVKHHYYNSIGAIRGIEY